MTIITVRPLGPWPYPEVAARRSPFRSAGSYGNGGYTPSRSIPYSDTEALLTRELRALGVTAAVLRLDVEERHIRQDGNIRSDARLGSPRVILNFAHPKQGPIALPCGTFATWQDNVRAIALSLEALRKVDRYGITTTGEQYSGWRALPSTTGTTMTATRAAELLAGDTNPVAIKKVLADRAVAQQLARAAVKRTHPDVGGKREDFEAVQTARRVLTAHFGAEV